MGTVTITFKKKTATVAYEDIKLAWAKDARTKELATSTIYNDPKVLITKSEFEQLTGKATVGTTNVKFVVDNDTHTLKVEIAEKHLLEHTILKQYILQMKEKSLLKRRLLLLILNLITCKR